ncbi:MAG: extracellular solute-binding protein [Lactobacillus crispatus]|jgi:arabinogalactan oligomer/maltooligosaccharide transport system substrate-binding protein|uniref:extracellular solute-binding protein n=1 Tax=Lactobacillus crispatus TaxID=47770 RepID=UPI0018A9F47F|nr:extracellular solute-binding protein [Lactobacillus crispatus]MCH4004283.1 extracellular solute-binding protein [Lactobacillus crispatus]MCI1335131.1 extracellular solute-binding protein [Lactobacillus crispatus]MCI1364545.1 extracellular solute-binding protein [Lactobacillus crispatus]MCI1493464.1 extracellular solute-binding protein [Lactobacillus crispatus]MCI1524444.1 extracellular solute-binding protein [Lactobacillus crispatus]
MKLWKKVLMCSSVVLAGLTLGACSNDNSNSTSSNDNKKPITLWVATDYVPWYKTSVKQFEKKYPQYKVKVAQSPNGTANAKTDVGKDPAKAADVFAVPNDQLGSMADAGYINPLSPKDVANIKKNDTAVAYKASQWKGKLYGYPYTADVQFLYYNKSKLSASDVKDWDTLTKKGVVATDFSNAYNIWPVMFSAGTKLFGDSGEDLKGSTMDSQNGVNGLKWVAEQKNNKGVMQTTNALNQLKLNHAQAILDGPWDAQNVRKILGKNFAVAPYPTITINGHKKQMQAFLGIGCFGVNSHTKNVKAANALAEFLTSKEQQLIVHTKTGETPVNKTAQATAAVKNDKVADAVMTMSKPGYSVIMPKMPQITTFWNESAPLLSGVYDHKVKPAQYRAKLAKLQKDISKK